MTFTGAKIALIRGADILAYLRDHDPTIPYPGHWDLPGGGREGSEDPVECALRETHEEFALRISRDRIHGLRAYPAADHSGELGYFMGAEIGDDEIDNIQFGDEGQFWRMMPITEFLSNVRTVPYLQVRLRDYLSTQEKAVI